MKISKWWLVVGSGIALLYLFTHLWKLTILPVFADESIYIRWAQLIIDDWKQYLFFPLNDGKTPLQMWLMIGLAVIIGRVLRLRVRKRRTPVARTP
jgi:hypothetical protein